MSLIANEYLLAWAVYAASALGCLLVWLRMTRPLWRWLREPLRLLVAVLLLTPTIVDPVRELFAPAVAITALDMLFGVGKNAWRAVADLALYGLVAFGIYIVLALVRWPIERSLRKRREARAANSDPRTLRERLEDDEDDEFESYPSAGRRPMRTEPRL